MKNKFYIILCALLMAVFIQFDAQSTQRGEPIQSQIEKGVYIPGEIVVPQNMRYLPVPKATNDYAFFQSIQKISNVVIGRFKIGDKEIILIQDNDNDGKVDIVAHWVVDLNRIDREGEPDKYCSMEDFKKLKEAIISGRSESVTLGGKSVTISPNKEGFGEMEKLVKTPSNVSKYKQGMRIKKIDPDERTNETMVFSYSVNVDNSVDMGFEVKYYQIGRSRISPIINMGVYCLKSDDPVAVETVKKFRETAGKYLPK